MLTAVRFEMPADTAIKESKTEFLERKAFFKEQRNNLKIEGQYTENAANNLFKQIFQPPDFVQHNIVLLLSWTLRSLKEMYGPFFWAASVFVLATIAGNVYFAAKSLVLYAIASL
ncbi:hypothetical protein [Rhodoferax ferrireducens]|nr:hypothetical protein [Rhodoferax ferrireducens]